MKKLVHFVSRIAVFAILALTPVHLTAQTASQLYTVPTVSALAALTTRPTQVYVLGQATATDLQGGVFNWVAGSATTADGYSIVAPSGAGTAGRWFRQLGLAVATAGLVDPRTGGAICDGATNTQATIQTTITAAEAARTTVMLPPNACLLNTGLTSDEPIVMRGMGSGVGPGSLDITAGTNILANYASGDVVTLTSHYGYVLSDLMFNTNAGLRSSGAGLHISGSPGATNGFSQLSNLSFNQQYDGILFTRPSLPIVERTYHQAWKNSAVTCVTTAGIEPTCGNYFNNYFFGSNDAATTQIAALNFKGGYTKVLANHLLGAQAGVLWDVGEHPAGAPNAFFNTIENSVHYGLRLKNRTAQTGSVASWIGNEFLTEGSTTGATLKAFMQIDANSTPGSTWFTGAQILGSMMRGQLTTTSGPGPAGVPAYISIDGVNNWQASSNIVSAMTGDTAVGVMVGPDARNGLVTHFQMTSETGAAVTKYAGTLTYTQILDIQGLTYAGVTAIAPANGSMIYVTDGQVGSDQQLASGGSGVWAFRQNGNWEPLGRTQGLTPPEKGGTGVANNAAATLTRSGNHALTITTSGTTGVTLPTSGTLAALGGTNTWTALNSFKAPSNGTNVTSWRSFTTNNELMRVYDDSGHGLLSVYNASASETARIYSNGASYFNGGGLSIGTTSDAGSGNLLATGTVRANTGFSANGTSGASATVSVRKGDDSGACNLVFSLGLYVSTTC